MAMILMGERTGSPEKCWGSFVQSCLEPPGGHYQTVVVQASFVAAPTQRIVQVLRRYVARCRRRERAAPEASDARVEDPRSLTECPHGVVIAGVPCVVEMEAKWNAGCASGGQRNELGDLVWNADADRVPARAI